MLIASLEKYIWYLKYYSSILLSCWTSLIEFLVLTILCIKDHAIFEYRCLLTFNLYEFFSFPCLIALTRFSTKMLNKSVWFFFLEQFVVHIKMRGRYRDVPYTPYLYLHSLLRSQHLPPQWYIAYNWWTYNDKSLSPEVRGFHYGSLLVFILWIWTNV